MHLREIGQRVTARRNELQLTQAQLAKLSGLSRLTINQLEGGSLKDLGAVKLLHLLNVLGLDLTLVDKKRDRGLFKAAVAANVSYRRSMTEEELADVLATGELSLDLEAPMSALLDEAPVPMIVSAVEEASEKRGVPPKQVWKHLSRWSRDLHLYRRVWQ